MEFGNRENNKNPFFSNKNDNQSKKENSKRNFDKELDDFLMKNNYKSNNLDSTSKYQTSISSLNNFKEKPIIKKPVVRIISIEEQLRQKEKEKENELKNKQDEKVSEPINIDFDAPPTIEQINRSSVSITSSKNKIPFDLSKDIDSKPITIDDKFHSINDENNIEQPEIKPIKKENEYVFESLILDSIDKRINSKGLKIKILKKFNMVLNDQDIVIVYGHQNSGKTTLLNILLFNELYDNGEYIINDKVLGELNNNQKIDFIKNNVILIHKSFQFEIDRSIYMVLLDNYNLSSEKFKSRFSLESIIDRFNIGYLMNKKYNELSLFEKQIILLVYAIINEKKIILFDEPVVLDNRQDDYIFKNLVRIANALFKNTILIATSYRNLFDISSKKYFLTKGTAKLVI